MTSPNTTIYTPFADGRPVRDIVEHTPALVDETWCRNLLRHTLDSLERQYAGGAPHRAITPDTVVMLANGDALLMPAPDEASAPGAASNLPADLQALAMVVHYAITAELPPDGPLGPRLYDNYSEQLTKGLDCCLGPNRRLRPKSVDDMRALLGIEAGASEVRAAPAVVPALPAVAPAAVESSLRPQTVDDMRALPGIEADASEVMAAPAVVQAAPAVAPAPLESIEPAPLPSPTDETPPASGLAAPAIAQARADAPLPELVNLRELAAGGMLRRPANQDAAVDKHTPAPPRAERTVAQPVQEHVEAAAAAPQKPSAAIPPSPRAGVQPVHERVEPAAAAPHKPSAAIPPSPRAGAAQARSAGGGNRRAQRWGMIAGAAIVVLAAGGAVFSYLQQDDARALVPLALPPAERAATGLDAGASVVAPATGAHPLDGTPEGAPGTAPATGPGAAGTAEATMVQGAGATNDAVINGTTYKLLIKPWGTVYVNGVDRGVSPPVKRLTLGPGQHTIRLANPNFPEHIMTVEAGQRETETIEHDFTAQAD